MRRRVPLALLALAACTPASSEPLDFEMEVTSATPLLTVTVGTGSPPMNIVVTNVDRATGPVTVRMEGTPVGVQGSCGPNPLLPQRAAAAACSVRADTTARPGSYEVRVIASGAGVGDARRTIPLLVRAR